MRVSKILTGQLNVNTYYAVDENTNKGFIVDPGGYHPALIKKIKQDNVDIMYVILTHAHHDHFGGIDEFLVEFPDSKFVASVHEKKLLEDADANFSNYFNGSTTLKPDIYVEDGEILTVGELELKFIHTPGHTPGGMCVYIEKEDCLFSGDTLLRQSIGRTDFPGSSLGSIKESITQKLFLLPEKTQVFPGHMEETDIGFEKRNNPFV